VLLVVRKIYLSIMAVAIFLVPITIIPGTYLSKEAYPDMFTRTKLVLFILLRIVINANKNTQRRILKWTMTIDTYINSILKRRPIGRLFNSYNNN
jgi:hypothetical protein